MQPIAGMVHLLPLLILRGHTVVDIAVYHPLLVAIHNWNDAVVE